MYIREPFPHLRLKIRETLGIEAKFTRLGLWDTLRRIVYDNYSVSRYGDGELSYFIKRRSLRFQPYRKDLGERVREAIMIPKEGILTCFNNLYRDTDRYLSVNLQETDQNQNSSERESEYIIGPDRRREQRSYVERWIKITRKTKIRTFGDATCFRLAGYVDEHAAGKFEEVKEDFRKIFRDKRILFICPEKPLAGLSFPELEPTLRAIGLRDAQYIFIPAIDAASEEERIRKELAEKRGYDDLFIQAGPLATAMAYELAGTIDGKVLDIGALNYAVPLLAPISK